jgi:hypothetical protein
MTQAQEWEAALADAYGRWSPTLFAEPLPASEPADSLSVELVLPAGISAHALSQEALRFDQAVRYAVRAAELEIPLAQLVDEKRRPALTNRGLVARSAHPASIDIVFEAASAAVAVMLSDPVTLVLNTRAAWEWIRGGLRLGRTRRPREADGLEELGHLQVASIRELPAGCAATFKLRAPDGSELTTEIHPQAALPPGHRRSGLELPESTDPPK